MRSFLIILKNNNIFISEFREGKFIKLKNNGEDSWEFKKSEFWKWWREKNEIRPKMSFSFVIFTDKSEFELPNDITISNNFCFEARDLKPFKTDISGLNFISYPPGFSLDESMDSEKEEIVDIEIKGSDIGDFYRKKTEEYRNK